MPVPLSFTCIGIAYLCIECAWCCVVVVQSWLTDVELFAATVAALIHDFEHTGTTNAFHVNTWWAVCILIAYAFTLHCTLSLSTFALTRSLKRSSDLPDWLRVIRQFAVHALGQLFGQSATSGGFYLTFKPTSEATGASAARRGFFHLAKFNRTAHPMRPSEQGPVRGELLKEAAYLLGR
jgi:hypothetical protein